MAWGFALHDSQEKYQLSADALILKDDKGLIFEEVRSLPDNAFKPNKDKIFSIENENISYWLKFKLNYYPNSLENQKNWFFEIAVSTLDVLDVYFVQNQNTTSHHLGGDKPHRLKSIKHSNYIVDFITHSKFETDVYLRVKNKNTVNVPIRVWSHEALFTQSQELQYLAGFCYGIMILAVIYNLVVSVTLKDKSYGYLSIYIFTTFLCLISFDGFARNYIWPNSSWWESRALFFWESLVIFWGIQFARNFINYKNDFPMVSKALLSAQVIAVALTIISIVFPGNIYSIYTVAAYSFISVFFIIYAAQLSYKSEKIYFISSWLPLYIVTIFLLIGKLELFGLNINSIDKRFIYYPLLTIHCLLLSLALTTRYNMIKNSKEKAEEHAILSLQRYKDLFISAAAGMFEITSSGEILFVNPKIIEMLGYKSEAELINTKGALSNELFANKADLHKYLRILLTKGAVANFEFQYKTKTDEIKWCLVSSRFVMHGDPHLYTDKKPNIEGSVIDITAAKEKESIEKRLLEAETSANVKSQLLASSSHELRTPMNAIIGFTSLLQKTKLNDKQFNYSEKVRVAAKGLLRLINDILDNSKLEAGEMKIESVNFNLDQLLGDVIDMFSEPFNEKGIELIILKQPELPINLKGDPLRIHQILINLINNAMKFTSEGHVCVTIEYIPSLENCIDLYFNVSDTGAGIAPERCERIFDPYQQADSSVAKVFGGTGLGLSVCKNLIEKMGGQINVQSSVGQGSDFMFSIHIQLQEGSDNGELEQYQELEGKTAFVIESNKQAIEQFKQELALYQINTVSVSSGEMALQRLISLGEADIYDFIIIERNLADNTGINIIKELKSEPSTSRIPIILTSKTGFDDLSERDRQSGINEFLVKPIKSNYLLKSLIGLFNLDYVPPSGDRVDHSEIKGLFTDKRILLVEDNQLNQELFTELLSTTGAHIDIANNGAEAVEILNESTYDIIMMDIQMPVLNGIEATKIIRKDFQQLNEVPIVALTANVLDTDIKEYEQAGMNGFIGKPIDFENLITTLKQWFDDSIQSNFQVADTGSKSQTAKGYATEYIDIQSGLKKLGGNKNLYFKVLNDFVTSYRSDESDLYAMLANKDKEQLARKFHSLKGISFNLGIDSIGELAIAAESAISDSKGTNQFNANDIKEYIDELYKSLDIIETEIDEIKQES